MVEIKDLPISLLKIMESPLKVLIHMSQKSRYANQKLDNSKLVDTNNLKDARNY